MVHVGGIGPSLGGALPKSPSFHQGLALATVLSQDSSKGYPVTFALHYQPLQPLLIGKALYRLNQFIIAHDFIIELICAPDLFVDMIKRKIILINKIIEGLI